MAQKGTRAQSLPARALRHGLSREILEDRLCAEVIDAAYAVREALGAWHEAPTYKNALALEIHSRGFDVHKDATLSVVYRGKVVGSFASDLLVGDRVVVVVRAEPTLTNDARTEAVRGLAHDGKLRVGLAVNFSQAELFFARVF